MFCPFSLLRRRPPGGEEEVAGVLKGAAGKEFTENYLKGEGYVKRPELAKQWLEEIPPTEVKSSQVLFKPLPEINPQVTKPETVVFPANPDQLSARVILADYGREGMENVIVPRDAGCQTIGILPYREAKSGKPRAVTGLTDI